MSVERQLVLIMCLFFLSFMSLRWSLDVVKDLYLSKRERKSRARGQTVKEWFLYSRYRSEIPKKLLFLYFSVLVFHPIALLCMFIACLIEPFREITHVLALAIFVYDLVGMTIVHFMGWRPKRNGPFHDPENYKRWVKKPKKNKR